MDVKRSAVRAHVPPQRLRFQWKGAHFSLFLVHALRAIPNPPHFEFRTTWPQDRMPKKKGAKVLKGKPRSPEVRLNSLAPRALAPCA